jgi:hypothetical protein
MPAWRPRWVRRVRAPSLHQSHQAPEYLDCVARIADHRPWQVGQPVEGCESVRLGIYEYQGQGGWRVDHRQAEDHRLEEDCFPRSSRPRHQDMGHVGGGQPDEQRRAILAQSQDRRDGRDGLLVAHKLVKEGQQAHRPGIVARYLDGDGGPAAGHPAAGHIESGREFLVHVPDLGDPGSHRGQNVEAYPAGRHAAAGHPCGHFVEHKEGLDAIGLKLEFVLHLCASSAQDVRNVAGR